MLRTTTLATLIAMTIPCGAQAKTAEDYLSEMQKGLPEGVVDELSKDIPKAKDVLKRCANREPWRQRSACMYLARGIAKPELADEIKPFLGDAHHRVRQDAIGALADSLGDASISELKRVAIDDKESFNRSLALARIYMLLYAKPLESKRDHHAFLKERLRDKSPLVKLTAAIELARAGIAVPRELAIDNLNAPVERYSDPSTLAYELLGFVGNEGDLKRLQKLVDEDKKLTPRQRLEYARTGRVKELDDAYKAKKAVLQLHMTLAKNEAERDALLRHAFRDEPDWARNEAPRRYFLGEMRMMSLLGSIASDSAHPGAASAAAGTISFIRERQSDKK